MDKDYDEELPDFDDGCRVPSTRVSLEPPCKKHKTLPLLEIAEAWHSHKVEIDADVQKANHELKMLKEALTHKQTLAYALRIYAWFAGEVMRLAMPQNLRVSVAKTPLNPRYRWQQGDTLADAVLQDAEMYTCFSDHIFKKLLNKSLKEMCSNLGYMCQGMGGPFPTQLHNGNGIEVHECYQIFFEKMDARPSSGSTFH